MLKTNNRKAQRGHKEETQRLPSVLFFMKLRLYFSAFSAVGLRAKKIKVIYKQKQTKSRQA
jgi:hypothetical protein